MTRYLLGVAIGATLTAMDAPWAFWLASAFVAWAVHSIDERQGQ